MLRKISPCVQRPSGPEPATSQRIRDLEPRAPRIFREPNDRMIWFRTTNTLQEAHIVNDLEMSIEQIRNSVELVLYPSS